MPSLAFEISCALTILSTWYVRYRLFNFYSPKDLLVQLLVDEIMLLLVG